MHVAFVTCSVKPGFTPDDALAAHELTSLGIEVEPVAWDGPSCDWTTFDAVVLRSTWNYHLHPNAFQRWLQGLEEQQVKVFNTPDMVRWNMHKGYLRELQQNGITIPETTWVRQGEQLDVLQLLRERQWTKAVVKPAISATAYQTFTVTADDASQQKVNDLAQTQDLLIQRFIEEVQTQGEWSLIFIDQQFSHAVIKKPKANDFRVQYDFGGSTSTSTPPQFVIEEATRILSYVKSKLLYARVDGVISKGQFLLMELELIEPALFLSYNKEAAVRFAKAIMG